MSEVKSVITSASREVQDVMLINPIELLNSTDMNATVH